MGHFLVGLAVLDIGNELYLKYKTFLYLIQQLKNKISTLILQMNLEAFYIQCPPDVNVHFYMVCAML